MFDLEKAVKGWMNELRQKQTLQDGDRAELESHFRDKIEDLLGASGSRIALELTREFAALVLLADLLALPAAYFLGAKLFSRYAYHVPLLWSYFALAGVASLLIAGLTVGSLTVRAANRNPVQALRYE